MGIGISIYWVTKQKYNNNNNSVNVRQGKAYSTYT
jgi:hypothetical protein